MAVYWLMKSELDVYPWSQLVEDGSTHWDGVRNYQARNFMRDDMQVGDLVLFYHSNCKPPHIAGIARVSREGYTDFTAHDEKSRYYDPKSTVEKPRWVMVDITPVTPFSKPIPLADLRANSQLEGMPLLQKGQRLSVQPVAREHFTEICHMAGIDPATM